MWFALSHSSPAVAHEPAKDSPPAREWVLSAEVAASRIRDGGVSVLDTRSAGAFARGHVAGAVRVDWTQFSQTADPHRGKLLPRGPLQDALRAVGIRGDRPVIVVGNPPHDWGEDGRIVWMLRAAGHRDAALVDGGIAALRGVGLGRSAGGSAAQVGDFVVKWDATVSAVRDDLAAPGVLVIDARTTREFQGATPYGESRGGHVPAARSLHFKTLMNDDGTQISVAAIRGQMERLGATPESVIIAYCTGGVRSGWLVAVLRRAGYVNVRNYAGSMWDWASAPVGRYPLVAQ